MIESASLWTHPYTFFFLKQFEHGKKKQKTKNQPIDSEVWRGFHPLASTIKIIKVIQKYMTVLMSKQSVYWCCLRKQVYFENQSLGMCLYSS